MYIINRIFNSALYRDGEFTISGMCDQLGQTATKGSISTALKKGVGKGQFTCRSARNGIARVNYYKAVRSTSFMRTAWVSTPTSTEYMPRWY